MVTENGCYFSLRYQLYVISLSYFQHVEASDRLKQEKVLFQLYYVLYVESGALAL